MQPKEKVGDIVIPSSNIDQLIDMVKRHYKKLNNEKKGIREIREIQQIFRGTLTENPEYINKKKRNAERSRSNSNSQGKLSMTQTSMTRRK